MCRSPAPAAFVSAAFPIRPLNLAHACGIMSTAAVRTDVLVMTINAIHQLVLDLLRIPSPSQAVQTVRGLPVCIGTTIGLHRTENQDVASCFKMTDSTGSIFGAAVCDGMGGMLNGRDCAKAAVAALFAELMSPPAIANGDRLTAAVEHANREVFRLYSSHGGTTLSCVVVDHVGNVSAVNVGDSRIYKYSSNYIELITRDDNVINRDELGAAFEVPLFGEHLTQYIGMEPGLEHCVIEQSLLKSTHKLLLASDGLWRSNEGAFEAVARGAGNASTMATRLLQLCDWCGGLDNASLIAIDDITFMSSECCAVEQFGVDLWTPDAHIFLPFYDARV